jgi:hypothetical protein
MTRPVTQLHFATELGPARHVPGFCHRTRPDQRMQPCQPVLLSRFDACRPAEPRAIYNNMQLGFYARLSILILLVRAWVLTSDWIVQPLRLRVA